MLAHVLHEMQQAMFATVAILNVAYSVIAGYTYIMMTWTVRHLRGQSAVTD